MSTTLSRFSGTRDLEKSEVSSVIETYNSHDESHLRGRNAFPFVKNELLENFHKRAILSAFCLIPKLRIARRDRHKKQQVLVICVQSLFEHFFFKFQCPLERGFVNFGAIYYGLSEKRDLDFECGPQLIRFRGGIYTARAFACEAIWRETDLSVCEA